MVVYKFPNRTDASPSNWPSEANTPSGDQVLDRYVPIDDPEHFRIKTWFEKVGAYLAMQEGLAETGEHVLGEFPPSFRLYVRETQKVGASVRKDAYLRGKGTIQFRSPAEFAPHAWWLYSDPSLNDANCGCGYCTKGGSGRTWLVPTEAGPARAREVNRDPWAAVRKLKREKIREGRELVKLEKKSVVVVENDFVRKERARDLETGRRFRCGEVIWVPTGPFRRDPTADEDDPLAIVYWPAIVYEVLLLRDPAATDASSAKRITGYRCETLAVKSSETIYESCGLPYHAFTPSPSIAIALRSSLSRLDALPSYDGPSQQTFDDLYDSWDDAIVAYAVAMTTADLMASRWLTTNSFCPGKPRREASRTERANWQGLWLGPERVWVGDLVRLSVPREELAHLDVDPSRAGPSSSSLYMQVTAIYRIRPGAEDATPARCSVSGQVYDLVPTPVTADGNPSPSSLTELSSPPCSFFASISLSSNALPYLPLAPTGASFRLLHSPTSQITIDVSEINTRYYSGLDKSIDFTFDDVACQTSLQTIALTAERGVMELSGNISEEDERERGMWVSEGPVVEDETRWRTWQLALRTAVESISAAWTKAHKAIDDDTEQRAGV